MDTTTHPRKSGKTTLCGFCQSGAHHLCPAGIRNGDGGIVTCVCLQGADCNAGKRRCTECNNHNAPEIGEDWRCIDRDACEAEQEAKRNTNPFVQQMAKVRAAREAQEAAAGVRTSPRAASVSEAPSRPARGGSRDCLCGCGGTTKGGKFLPGHDSRYLSRLVDTTDIWEASEKDVTPLRTKAYTISEAFGKKYDKRVGTQV